MAKPLVPQKLIDNPPTIPEDVVQQALAAAKAYELDPSEQDQS